MPVGEFTAISLLIPLVITLLAGWLLKEKIRPLRWLLLLGGIRRHPDHHPSRQPTP